MVDTAATTAEAEVEAEEVVEFVEEASRSSPVPAKFGKYSDG